MDISPLVAIIPVILAAALIIVIVRRNITERQPGDPIDIAGAVPAFVILMVAVILIGGMASSVAPYSWNEDSGELTINQNVGTGDQKWDSFGADVKSLIINDNVSAVADGAFDTLTGLEYISISDNVESITSSAFGVTLKDYLDQTITEPEAGEYVGTGDGTLYLCDGSIFTYNSAGTQITGLASASASAAQIVLPASYNGKTVESIGANAFMGKTSIAEVLAVPSCSISALGNNVFKGCTGLAFASIPSVRTVGSGVFEGCTALESVPWAAVAEIGNFDFYGCTSLSEVIVPSTVTAIGQNAFYNCTGVETIHIPASVTSIMQNVFKGCTSITSVSFGDGFNASLGNDWAYSWTFYDSDGTTTLDKTVAANLAGFTFQGTASALVKVLPDRSALTTEQTLQVQELTKKAASKTLLLDEKELAVDETETKTFEMDSSEQEKASA